MADEEDQTEENEVSEGEEEEEEGKKGSKKKLLILILVPLLLIGGGGGAAYYLGYLDSLLGIKSECPKPELDEHGDPIVELDEHGDPVECEHHDGSAEDDGHGNKKKDDHGKKGDGHDGDSGGESAFVAVQTMRVNLSTEDGTPRYLQLKVQLELADPSEAGEVESVMPIVIDQFQTYLRGLRVRDLRGSAGIYRLQIELLNRVNKAVDPIEIKDVLFQEILIQ